MGKLGITPANRVRFAFWGAEEWGLLGSKHYVDQLTSEELSKIVLNLNYDMLGSPNPVSFVYDGDGSETGPVGPPGSAEIEGVFLDYFRAQNLPTRPTAFDGRSDYGPFIDKGIPAGGLFSGAEGVKTPAQAAVFGGTAGSPTTSAITWPATTSPTTTTPRWTSSATRRRMRCYTLRPSCRPLW